MEIRRVRAGEVTLEIAEAGAGGRPFLLIHGFTGAKGNFTEFLDRLAARGWHAVAPDLRGHGASDHPAGEDAYSLAIFTTDLLALADALGWTRFALLGESMGGMVAEHLAIAHLDRVTALVLMDTTDGPMDVDPALLDEARAIVRSQGLPALLDIMRAARDRDPLVTPAYLRLLRERPGYAEECDRRFLASSPDMWLAISAEAPTRPDALADLAGLAVRTLVIVGEQDTLRAHSERLAATVPGARLAVVPDAGHSPQFENPDAWWSEISAFLDCLDL